MRRCGFLAAFGLAICTAAHAGPCIPDLLSNYLTLGPGGCSVGSLLVKDFNYSLVAGTVAINASDITVTPFAGGDTVALTFASSIFSAAAPDFAQYRLGYTWDPGDIRTGSDVLNDPVTAPGLGKITTSLCEDAAFIASICPTTVATLTVFDNGTSAVLFDSTVFSPPIGTVGTSNLIDLDARAGGSVKVLSFTNELSLPEPATLASVLAGMALVGGFGVKRRQGGFQLAAKLRGRMIGKGGRQ